MVKKIITGAINFISIVLIVFSVAILISVVLTKNGQSPSFLGFSSFRVLTGSMSPEIPVDSMVIVRKTDPETIKEGDVITYYTDDPDIYGSVVTHRVTGVNRDGAGISFTTRGDANYKDDDVPAAGEKLIGKVVLVSPFMGKLVRLAANPLIFIGFIIIPLLIMLVINIRDTVKAAREIEAEEMGAQEDGWKENKQ